MKTISFQLPCHGQGHLPLGTPSLQGWTAQRRTSLFWCPSTQKHQVGCNWAGGSKAEGDWDSGILGFHGHDGRMIPRSCGWRLGLRRFPGWCGGCGGWGGAPGYGGALRLAHPPSPRGAAVPGAVPCCRTRAWSAAAPLLRPRLGPAAHPMPTDHPGSLGFISPLAFCPVPWQCRCPIPRRAARVPWGY